MGTPTRKLGMFFTPVKGVDAASIPPNNPGPMVDKDVTKLEGVVGTGIRDKVFRNVGVLATITDSFPDTSTAMAHP
jgi:hypothetical protein